MLFALGLAPATREALPFGIGLALIGAVAGLIGTIGLVTGLRSDEPAGEVALGLNAARPPSTVVCPGCGGSAPVRVAEPTHSSCPFCHSRFPLAVELASRLQHAALLLQRQAESERQIASSVASLAARQQGWVLRVLGVAAALSAIAFASAAYGWIFRADNHQWYAWLSFGLTSLFATALLAVLAVLTVPPWMRRILGRWSALRLPGVEGLACRECGAPLPPARTPVLRCSYCAADNVAGREVLQVLAAGARAKSRSALAVAERRRVGEEIAAAGFVAFPLLVLLTWFAAGAAAGSLVIALARDVELEPDDDQRYAVVRADGRVCLAATRTAGSKVALYLRAGSKSELSANELPRYSVHEPVSAAWLVGRTLDTGARVRSAYRRFDYLTSHVLRTDAGAELYLPWPEGGGELVCLDLAPGSGPTLSSQ